MHIVVAPSDGAGRSGMCRPYRPRRHTRKLPLARALHPSVLQVALDVAEAMCFLHPRIVHRDLKPQASRASWNGLGGARGATSCCGRGLHAGPLLVCYPSSLFAHLLISTAQNVLLTAEGRAKVCDFGIAKFKNNTLVSSAGGQAGTPAYMAPESECWGEVAALGGCCRMAPSARQQQVVSVHGGHEAAEWLVLLSQDARLPPQRRPSLPPCRAAFDGKRVNEKVREGLPC